MDKKILFISPHFSTGGSPQVTYNKVMHLMDNYKIKVVEFSFLSWKFVVQRNAMRKLLTDANFITLDGTNVDKANTLQAIISDFRPDIISMEEFPEMFMNDELSDIIYSETRDYKILETTHDSSFDLKNKRYFPDKFIFVSAYNAIKYIQHFNNTTTERQVEIEIIEYPVDYEVRDRFDAINKLNIDKNYKHVAIIGLFTPRKNQKYVFEIAERLKDYDILFHFIGNQADNFSYYWKPLLDNKPDNCIIWGERDDADTFIQASDLFLFASKGDKANKELNPIVIKEAAKYKDLPKLLFNLDVYLHKYNNDDSFHFLTGEIEADIQKVIELTKIRNQNIMQQEEIIIVGTYPNLKKREELTISCINSLKGLNRKIMLVSHYPVSIEIQKLVDYYVYDADNQLTEHSYYNKFYNYRNDYDVEMNINGIKNSNQSLPVLTNIFNAFKSAKVYGYLKAFYITYDVVVDERDYSEINHSFSSIDDRNKAYLATINTPFGHGIQTTAMTLSIDYFLENFNDVKTPDEYNQICKVLNCQNFLEDYFYKIITGLDVGTYKLITNDKETFLKNSGLGVSSNSEYYSILPVVGKPNHYVFYFFTYNIDERKIEVTINNGSTILKYLIDIKSTREYKIDFEHINKDISIIMDFYDGDNLYKSEKYVVSESNLDTYKKTGFFKYKVKPKIKVVHLQTTLGLDKENKSYAQVSSVANHNWEYVIHKNVQYGNMPPTYNCMRPHCVSMELFDDLKVEKLGTALTPAHYGCYESFKNGILSEFDNDIDFLIVCEGDCKIIPEIEEFILKVENICNIIKDTSIGYVSLGDIYTLEQKWLQSPMVEEIPNQNVLYITNHIIGLQCIMFPQHVRKWLFNKLMTHPWDGADMYFNTIFRHSEYKMAIVKDRLTTQFDGYSLIDKQDKKFL